ncbi:hypothetical protein HanIR_Chr16g0819991 [Helianthus annuus]|nr:hypothetical protein HanIR_Chr16g0819991 [Helianthus annuus]
MRAFSFSTISIFLIASCTTSAIRLNASCGAITPPSSVFGVSISPSAKDVVTFFYLNYRVEILHRISMYFRIVSCLGH